MPFTPVSQLPEGPPSVRIFLTGQLILEPNDTSSACEVFVNRSAPNHHLTVEVREKREGQPDYILMRHHGPLEYRNSDDPVDGLLISRSTASKVEKYSGPPATYGEALSAAINLGNRDFHPGKKLPIDHDSARPSIMIIDGIFHTAEKTSSDLDVKLKRGEKSVRDLPAFASLIGANIYLKDNEELRLQWHEMGLPRTLALKKPGDGLTYEVYIINDPLYDDPEEGKSHDEFAQYYKVLPSVPTTERLTLEVTQREPIDPERGSAKTPCMPVVINDP